MAESPTHKLIEVLRKAVSRTSMLAEGYDPELDSVIRQIRYAVTQGVDPDEILEVLNDAEPLLLKSDQAQMSRAQQVKTTLLGLIEILKSQAPTTVPQNERKKLESLIKKNWKVQSQWPALFSAYKVLAERTFEVTNDKEASIKQPKSSFLSRLLNRQNISEHNPSTNPELVTQMCHALAGLLDNLQLPQDDNARAQEFKKTLLGNENLEQLPLLLDEVIHFVMIVIGKSQENLASYLTELNSQLANINESITESFQSQKTLSKSREGFNNALQKQVIDTSKAIKDIDDLDSLKSLINNRLSTISKTMKSYRAQMQEQEEEATQSITALTTKVARMEKDTASLRTLLQQKHTQAMTDSLTELPNRTAYQDTILPLCKIMQKTKRPLCLAVCDIDHFKRVNDTWGHLAGDKVLRLVPKQIRQELRKEDLIFRYGGEEFVIVFPNTTGAQTIELCETIRKAIEKTPFNMQGDPISVSVSIGVAQLNANEDPESLFERADKQLYIAKDSGRNQVIMDK